MFIRLAHDASVLKEEIDANGKNKYVRPEWERRFLLESFPVGTEIHRSRKIVDRYIAGTTLRLRRQIDDEGSTLSKLTQKSPTGRTAHSEA